VRIARTQGGTAPAGGGDKAGAGGLFEQGTARDGRRTHGIRRRRLDDLVHNNLRDGWLYPPGLQSAPSDRHQRAASSASTNTLHRGDQTSKRRRQRQYPAATKVPGRRRRTLILKSQWLKAEKQRPHFYIFGYRLKGRIRNPTFGAASIDRVRMCLSRTGPVTALVLSGTALALLAVAPFGLRLGWWPYSFGLYWLMPVSGFVAAVAVILSVLTLARGWSQLRLPGLAMLFIALALGAALVYVPSQYWHTRSTLPPIHDITTDTDNSPTFSAVLAARAFEGANSVDYRGLQLAQMQKAAYPDVAPVITALPVTRAFNEALHVAKSMPGWIIVAFDADAGRIEASQQSRWFRFTDDIVIRVVGDEVGSRIDMRSTSRHGHSDYGVNAARIRAYIGALLKRID
jgi:uncharacterized protein (DUF1499 family)